MDNFVKCVLMAFLIMSLPIFIAIYALIKSSPERAAEITITPGKTYVQQETLSKTGRVRVVRTTRYRWKKCVTETTIDTVKVSDNAAADAAYINHAVGISGW
jgi:hypothetical protein